MRLDAASWGLKLIAWIHGTVGAIAVISWNPKRQIRRDGLPPTWTWEELGKRSSIERFFCRTFLFFRSQCLSPVGWSALATRVALTYAAAWVVALAVWQAHRPELIRSPRSCVSSRLGGWCVMKRPQLTSVMNTFHTLIPT